MTAMVNVLMTGIVIAGGAFAIVYALRFFHLQKSVLRWIFPALFAKAKDVTSVKVQAG